VAAAQPRGTVTLLFSDVEGSTALQEELGVERHEGALEQQRRVIREAVVAHEGYEVSCEADSFFVAFSSASAAVEAAVAAQQALLAAEWPDGRQAKVRMGVHTGKPRVVDANYLGVDVHQAPGSWTLRTAGRCCSRRRPAGRSMDVRCAIWTCTG
jgi:class 3 adenylate cyclase